MTILGLQLDCITAPELCKEILVFQEYCSMRLDKPEASMETAEQLVLMLLQFHMKIFKKFFY
jgi:hypothetical protein